MAFQTSIAADIVSGYIGELSHKGPMRAIPARIAANATQADCLIGRAYTYADETAETVRPGGTGQFAGILISPKSYPRQDLYDDTLDIPLNSIVQLLQMGYVFVQLASAGASIGSSLVYHTTTGALDWTDTPSSPPADHALVPNAIIDRHMPSSATPRLALVKLTN